MMDKTLSLISLSRKAGKLKMGSDPCLEAVASGQARLVLYASDLSPRTKLRLEDACSSSADPPPRLALELDMFQLSQVCGKRTGVLAILDDGFARGLRTLICPENKEE